MRINDWSSDVCSSDLPAALRLTRRSVNHLLRPAGTAAMSGNRPELYVVCLERGVRAVLLIGAALLLARAWQIDLVATTAPATLVTGLLCGALNAAVLMLIAAFAWHVGREEVGRR